MLFPILPGVMPVTSPARILKLGGEDMPPKLAIWLRITKRFDLNYHCLVLEIGPETNFRLASDIASSPSSRRARRRATLQGWASSAP